MSKLRIAAIMSCWMLLGGPPTPSPTVRHIVTAVAIKGRATQHATPAIAAVTEKLKRGENGQENALRTLASRSLGPKSPNPSIKVEEASRLIRTREVKLQ